MLLPHDICVLHTASYGCLTMGIFRLQGLLLYFTFSVTTGWLTARTLIWLQSVVFKFLLRMQSVYSRILKGTAYSTTAAVCRCFRAHSRTTTSPPLIAAQPSSRWTPSVVTHLPR